MRIFAKQSHKMSTFNQIVTELRTAYPEVSEKYCDDIIFLSKTCNVISESVDKKDFKIPQRLADSPFTINFFNKKQVQRNEELKRLEKEADERILDLKNHILELKKRDETIQELFSLEISSAFSATLSATNDILGFSNGIETLYVYKKFESSEDAKKSLNKLMDFLLEILIRLMEKVPICPELTDETDETSIKPIKFDDDTLFIKEKVLFFEKILNKLNPEKRDILCKKIMMLLNVSVRCFIHYRFPVIFNIIGKPKIFYFGKYIASVSFKKINEFLGIKTEFVAIRAD